MLKKKVSPIIVIIIIILFIYMLKKPGYEGAVGGGSCTLANCVDFTTTQGNIEMFYGTNEDGSWKEFSNDVWYQDRTKEVNTKYIRTWLSAHWYRTKTFPLNSDGTYTWTNVDKFVDAVLATGATPFILFVHGDRCNSNTPFDFSNCEGFGVKPPSNINAFGDYVATVAQHFVDRYGYDEVNTWYFEILNEPFGWSDYQPYWDLFVVSEQRIKEVVPNAKVGGGDYGGTTGALNAGFDFIDRHLYPCNVGYGSNPQEVMDSLNGIYNKILSYKQQGIEIVSGEYNIDTGASGTNALGYNFQNTWMVAALINQIKAGASMELWYEGTYGDNNVWGLWSTNPAHTLRKAYYGKKQFTSINPTGAVIYANTDSGDFDILAVQSDKRYITIVNKKDYSNSMNLEILGDVDKLINLETLEEHIVSSNVNLNFNGYEVKFLEVVGTGCSLPYDNSPCGIDNNELGNAILGWFNDDIDRNQLGYIINDWVSS